MSEQGYAQQSKVNFVGLNLIRCVTTISIYLGLSAVCQSNVSCEIIREPIPKENVVDVRPAKNSEKEVKNQDVDRVETASPETKKSDTVTDPQKYNKKKLQLPKGSSEGFFYVNRAVGVAFLGLMFLSISLITRKVSSDFIDDKEMDI